MNTFDELIETLAIIEEAGSRDKAKDFKSSMKPLVKRMKTAKVGDPRRYAYMLLWPFLRDELGVPEIQGEDCPKNSALIQRKLEEVWERGELPDDAGARFTAYAEEQFDTHVNTVSTTKRKTSPKSHYKGGEVKTHIDVAGGGSGFTEGESASERAAREAMEAELRAKQEAEGGPAPEDRLKTIGIDVDNVEDEFKNAVTDIADTLQPSDTTIVEIVGKEEDGPIVQKQQIIKHFENDLVEIDDEGLKDDTTGYARLEFELKPDSEVSKMVTAQGAEKVEKALERHFSGMLGREIRVIVHAPEVEDFLKPVKDPVTSVPDELDDDDDRPFVTNRDVETYPKKWEDEEEGAAAYVQLPQGSFLVFFRNGEVSHIECEDRAVPCDFDIDAVNQALRSGDKIEKAMQKADTSRISDSVMVYMPVGEAEYEEPVILETTRERLAPQTNHQISEYHRLLG